jgi:hypothetical protein
MKYRMCKVKLNTPYNSGIRVALALVYLVISILGFMTVMNAYFTNHETSNVGMTIHCPGNRLPSGNNMERLDEISTTPGANVLVTDIFILNKSFTVSQVLDTIFIFSLACNYLC